jgi:F-type H+-transporting ATPase subunit c
MKKSLRLVFLTVATFVLTAGAALAQEAGADVVASNLWAKFLGAGLAIGIAAQGTGMGMGRAIASALEAVSRNPSVAPRIMTMMILGLALIESLAIYSLVVSILLLFVI